MINKLFGVATVVLVLGGVVAGFMFLGSPAHGRLVALDERRIDDLQSMSSRINQRYSGRTLPAALPPGVALDDPQTHRPYAYRREGNKTYTLCATFALPSEKQDTVSPYSDMKLWGHRAGTACFPQHTGAP